VVQSADPASGLDDYRSCRTLLYGARHGSVLVDSEMSPVFIVVGPVLAEQTPKVLLVGNDDVVEQLRVEQDRLRVHDHVPPRRWPSFAYRR